MGKCRTAARSQIQSKLFEVAWSFKIIQIHSDIQEPFACYLNVQSIINDPAVQLIDISKVLAQFEK